MENQVWHVRIETMALITFFQLDPYPVFRAQRGRQRWFGHMVCCLQAIALRQRRQDKRAFHHGKIPPQAQPLPGPEGY